MTKYIFLCVKDPILAQTKQEIRGREGIAGNCWFSEVMGYRYGSRTDKSKNMGKNICKQCCKDRT